MKKDTQYGYAGKILHVDLTRGTTEDIPITPEMIHDYIGGFGFAAKLVYDYTTPREDPFSPGNPLVIAAPVLGGTFIPTSGRTVVMGKSPLSGFLGISHMGEPGAMMKFSGYDQILVTGKAAKPSYIKVENGKAEIRNAKHLWGLGVSETVDVLWQELGGEFYVTCIGPAGENKVRFASILSNKYSAAGRSGLGAVMGSKNLKAIAFYGDNAIEVASPAKVARIAKSAFARMVSHPSVPGARKYGTLFQVTGEQGRKYSRQRYLADGSPAGISEVFDLEKYYERIRARNLTCFSCPIGCKQEIAIKQGEYAGSNFPIACSVGTMARPFGYQLAVQKYEDIAKCAQLNNNYGMDSHTTDHLIGLVIDLQHRGIVKPEQTDGLSLEWGDTRTIIELMRKTAFREGFGAVLAEGPVGLCRKLGLNPEDYVIYAKNIPFSPLQDARMNFGPTILGECVNPRGPHFDFHRPISTLTALLNMSPDYLKGVCKKLGVSDEEMDRVVTGKGRWGGNIPRLACYVQNFSIILYCLGTCDRDYVNIDIYDIDQYSDILAAVTGIKTSPAELLRVGERIWNLLRLYNVREGASRKDDQLPKIMYTQPLKTIGLEFPPFDVSEFNNALDEYYDLRGWDREGRPGESKLAELGLKA